MVPRHPHGPCHVGSFTRIAPAPRSKRFMWPTSAKRSTRFFVRLKEVSQMSQLSSNGPSMKFRSLPSELLDTSNEEEIISTLFPALANVVAAIESGFCVVERAP